MKGQINNHSSKMLWVVETDSGKAVAHRLDPNKRSPPGVDADGFKAVDGTPVDGHTSWVKVTNISTADVKNEGGGLTRGCVFCWNVQENEFGPVTYDNSPGWGQPL